MAESKRVGEQTVFVYQSVIDDVIARVKPEFSAEGVDESVLDELRTLWEAKLVQTGVLGDPNQAEVAQAIGAATQPRPRALPAAMPAVPQYPQYHQQVPASVPTSAHQYHVAAVQQFQQLQGMTQLMQPQQPRYAAPPSLPMAAFAAAAPQAATSAAAAAAAALEDRKRKLEGLQGVPGGPPIKREQLALPQQGALPRPSIPQQDGPADDGGEAEAGAAEDGGEPEEELNENDDLAAVDDEEVDEEQLKDVVLGQWEKVSRTKARWKVQFKDCIITAHGRDYLVHKATGEMNF